MARQLDAPARELEVQRVPALRVPALGDARSLKHQVFAPALAQMPAQGKAGLSCADHDILDAFHATAPPDPPDDCILTKRVELR
jgi:hypothetical protein